MTHQFKFGDRAIHSTSGSICLIVDDTPVTTDDGDILWCVVDEDGFGGMCSDYKLTPTPHPDTVRLDWLARNDCALTERLCDEDGDRLDTPFAVIQKQEEHFEVLAAACDIRDAIDEAMRLAESDNPK